MLLDLKKEKNSRKLIQVWLEDKHFGNNFMQGLYSEIFSISFRGEKNSYYKHHEL